MAEQFDPYYKWLGISPQNQPPHLYRLLSLELFERDPEVIEAAANRQMSYIQGCATGQYVEYSQQLLNEIAAARLLLLDARQKQAYDVLLKKSLADGQAAPSLDAFSSTTQEPRSARSSGSHVPPRPGQKLSARNGASPPVSAPAPATMPAPPPAAAFPEAAALAVAAAAPTPTSRVATARRARQRSNPWIPVAALSAVLLVVGGVWFVAWLLSRDDTQSGSLLSNQRGSAGRASGQNASDSVLAAGSRDRGGHAQSSQGNGQAGGQSDIAIPGEATAGEPTPTSAGDQASGDEFGGGSVGGGQMNPEVPPSPPIVQPGAGSPDVAPQTYVNEFVAALQQANGPAAIAALEKYLQHPTAGNKQEFEQYLQIVRVASDDNVALQSALNMTDEAFAALQQGEYIAVQDLPQMFWPLFNASLRRNLPEAIRRRDEARAAQTPPPQPPPSSGEPGGAAGNPAPAPQVPPVAPPPVVDAGSPVEVLRVKGLQRVWNKWSHTDEARLGQLLDQCDQLKKEYDDLQKEQRTLAGKLKRAQSKSEKLRSEVETAEQSGDPPSGSDELRELEDKAVEARHQAEDLEDELRALEATVAPADDRLKAAVTEARQVAEALDEIYSTLEKDPQVTKAAAELNQTVGPGDDYHALQSRVKRLPRPR